MSDADKKTKARRGSGSIYRQKGTTNWTIKYYCHGHVVREATGSDDYRAAQQKLTARLARIDNGETVPAKRQKPILVSELYAGLEGEYVRVGHRSLKALKLRWQHLKETFENHTAGFVTKETIEAYCDARLRQGAARSTINRELAALKRMFRRAADKLPKLPSFPGQLEEKNVRTGFIEDEEFAALVANASALWLRTFLEVAYSVGWRSGEILNLRVRQVDLRARMISLDGDQTKSGEPRHAPMTAKMHQLLKECIAGKQRDDYVLTRATRCGPKRVKDLRKIWKVLVGKIGRPDLLVHDFRRSAARNLRKAGAAENTIMQLAGWETASVFRRYDIQDDKDKVVAIADLEKKRALDQLQREQEQREQAETEFGHSFGHSRASAKKSAEDFSERKIQ